MLEEARDRTLKKWRTAKQAESRDRIARAIDLFSAELLEVLASAYQKKVKPDLPQTQTWENKAASFLEEVNWNA